MPVTVGYQAMFGESSRHRLFLTRELYCPTQAVDMHAQMGISSRAKIRQVDTQVGILTFAQTGKPVVKNTGELSK